MTCLLTLLRRLGALRLVPLRRSDLPLFSSTSASTSSVRMAERLGPDRKVQARMKTSTLRAIEAHAAPTPIHTCAAEKRGGGGVKRRRTGYLGGLG